MKKKSLSIEIVIFLGVFILAGPARAAAPPKVERLTLTQAVERGLQKSPLVVSSRHELAASSHALRAAKGELLPRVDAYASYTRTSDPVVVVPIKSFGGTPPTFSRDLYGGGVHLTLPIYQGGVLRARVSLARFQKELARHNLEFTREELAYTIRNVFDQAIFLERLQAAQEETLKALKRLRRDAKARLEVGRLRPVDLMRIDAQVKGQEAALSRTREGRKRALHLLARLLGDEGLRLEPVGSLRTSIDPSLIPPPDRIASLVELRPDIQRAKADVKVKEAEVRVEKGLHLPSLDLVGDYGRRAGSGMEGDEEVWQGGVNLSLNLFSGGVISSRIKEATEKYIAAQERLREARLEAMQQARDALSRIREAQAKVVSQRQALEAARESFRIERIRYEAGAGTVTDVLLAQSQWLTSKAGLIGACYDLERGLADLDFALGRTVQRLTGSGPADGDKAGGVQP